MNKHEELFKGKLAPKYQPLKPNKKIGDRLELYRKFLNMKAYTFCIHIGISQGSYSDLANNKSLPSCGTLANIARREECDLKWLLTGKK